MYKAKFLEIFKNLPKESFKKFGLFISSPYFNSNKKLIELYRLVKKEYPGFNGDILLKQNVFRLLFPGKKFNDESIRGLSSDLLKLAEKFLLQENISGFNSLFDATLINGLISNGNHNLAFKHIKKFQNDLLESTSSEASTLKNLLMQIPVCNYYSATEDTEAYMQSRDKYVEFSLEYFLYSLLAAEIQFIVKKYLNRINENNTTSSRVISAIDIPALLTMMKENNSKNYSQVELMYLIMLYRKDPANLNYFDDLRKSYYRHFEELNIFDKNGYLVFYSNACKTAMDHGIEDTREELHSLYLTYLSQKLYYRNRKNIPVGMFREIFLNAIELNETAWVKNFVEEYSPMLHEEYVLYFTQCADIFLSFHKKDFERSLKLISRLEFKEKKLVLKTKQVEVKIYFEQNDINSIEFSLNRYLKYLVNNFKKQDIRYRRYMNFYNACVKLLKLILNQSKADKIELYNNLSKNDQLDQKDWLLEIINRLNRSDE